jgi:hypothetical protein
LEDAKKDFENLVTNELPKLNETLKGKNQPAIEAPPAKAAANESEMGAGGFANGAVDRDLPASAVLLPANFRLLR